MRHAAPERSSNASVEATQAEVLHCIYIALAAKYPKAVHSACWTVHVLVPTAVTNTHLAPSRKTPRLVYRKFTCLFLYQSLRRGAFHHPLCPKMGVKLTYVVVVQQERLREAFNRGMGKPVTTEAGSWCSQQNYQAALHFLVYSASWQSVNSRLRIQLNCRYNPFKDQAHPVTVDSYHHPVVELHCYCM